MPSRCPILSSCAFVVLASCSTAAIPRAPTDAQAPAPTADAGTMTTPSDAATAAHDDAFVIESPDAAELDAGSPALDDASATPDSDAGAFADAAATLGPYANDGVETYTTTEIELTNAGRSFTEHIYIPDSAGPHAVVLFGSGTQQPARSYVAYARRLATWGMVVLLRDDPGPLTRTQVLAADLAYVGTQWLPAQNADPNSVLYGKLDLTRIGVGGHSRGGKATLLAAEGGLHGSVRGYFGVDMVDVTFIDDGVYSITEVANVGIPTAFLVASVPSNCSPTNANGEVLYNAAPSPSVLITGIGAGHTDFAMPCVACSICTPDGTVDPQIVFDYSVRYATAFFARELLGDLSVGPAFEGAGAPLDTTAGLVAIHSK